MNNASLSVDPIQTVHFLSVFNYMNTLSDIFYGMDLIGTKERNQPFPIVNAVFDYLDDSLDDMEKRENLIRRLLQNSDLYGGEDNEILDLGYINATFDYIISSIVFSRFGNVYGYLAGFMSRAKNLTFFSFEDAIIEDLKDLEYMNEDGTMSSLTLWSIAGILYTLIMPLFPEPEDDMRLTDVDYIYAQAGLQLARSNEMDLTNLTFEEYIPMSQAIEIAASKNESYQSALQIFTLPALLFHAHQEENSFKEQTVAHLLKKQDFWIQILQKLFSHLQDTFEIISQEKIKSSPAYQFAIAINDFKNRTSIAREMLKKHCPGIPENKYESEIKDYKFWASCSFCFGDIIHGLPIFGRLFFSSKLLPNIDELYSAQMPGIEQKYRLLAKALIRKAFEDAHLKDVIDSSDTTIFWSGIEPQLYPNDDGVPIDLGPRLQPNMHLFTMRNRNSSSLLAIIDNQNDMTVLKEEDDPEHFWKPLGLEGEEFSIMVSSTPTKSSSQSFNDFNNNFADVLTKDFIENLRNHGYDKTTGEKVLDFLLSLIPLYNCITSAWAGRAAEATFACMMDIVLLIPFGGELASVGSKLSLNLAQRLGEATGISARTLTLKLAIELASRAGPRKVLAESVAVVKKELITIQMFKDLSLGLIRSIDPGLGFIGRSVWKGGSKLVELFKRIWQNAAKSPSMISKLSSFEKGWIRLENTQKLTKDGKFVTSSTQVRCKRTPPVIGVNPLPGACSSRQVNFRMYPGGRHPQGPELVSVPGGMAELRKSSHYGMKKLVKVSRISRFGKVFYKRVHPKTGQVSGSEMRLNHYGLLENVVVSIPETLRTTSSGDSMKKLLLKRERNIEESAEFISKSKLKIPKERARALMERFILADEPAQATHSEMRVPELDGSQGIDIDVGNPDVLRQYWDPETDFPLSMEIRVNQYTGKGVPTFADFALDFVENNGLIRDVYNPWFVNNLEELNQVLYLSHFEVMKMEHKLEANQRIVELYGPHYQQELNVNLENIIQEYISNQAWRHVNFEDFFAIFNFVKNRYVVMQHNENANSLLYIALLRLALRQGTDKILSKRRLYLVQRESSRMYSHVMSMKSAEETITLRHFQVVSPIVQDGSFTAEKIARENPNVKLAFFKIISNSGYPTANINEIMRREYRDVIIPNTRFGFQYKGTRSFEGSTVLDMEMSHLPNQREMCLRDIAREIEALQEARKLRNSQEIQTNPQ